MGRQVFQDGQIHQPILLGIGHEVSGVSVDETPHGLPARLLDRVSGQEFRLSFYPFVPDNPLHFIFTVTRLQHTLFRHFRVAQVHSLARINGCEVPSDTRHVTPELPQVCPDDPTGVT